MLDVFTMCPGKWAVIDVVSQKYLGRIDNYEELDRRGYSGPIELSPAFDYSVNLMQQPNGMLAKNVICLPTDMTSDLSTKVIITNAVSILLFDNMTLQDKRSYQDIVNKGVEILEQVKAEKSGITLARNIPNKGGIIF